MSSGTILHTKSVVRIKSFEFFSDDTNGYIKEKGTRKMEILHSSNEENNKGKTTLLKERKSHPDDHCLRETKESRLLRTHGTKSKLSTFCKNDDILRLDFYKKKGHQLFTIR